MKIIIYIYLVSAREYLIQEQRENFKAKLNTLQCAQSMGGGGGYHHIFSHETEGGATGEGNLLTDEYSF